MQPMNRKEQISEEEPKSVLKPYLKSESKEPVSENKVPSLVIHTQYPNLTITPVSSRTEARITSSSEGSLKISIRYADITPPIREKPVRPKSPVLHLQSNEFLPSVPKGISMVPQTNDLLPGKSSAPTGSHFSDPLPNMSKGILETHPLPTLPKGITMVSHSSDTIQSLPKGITMVPHSSDTIQSLPKGITMVPHSSDTIPSLPKDITMVSHSSDTIQSLPKGITMVPHSSDTIQSLPKGMTMVSHSSETIQNLPKGLSIVPHETDALQSLPKGLSVTSKTNESLPNIRKGFTLVSQPKSTESGQRFSMGLSISSQPNDQSGSKTYIRSCNPNEIMRQTQSSDPISSLQKTITMLSHPNDFCVPQNPPLSSLPCESISSVTNTFSKFLQKCSSSPTLPKEISMVPQSSDLVQSFTKGQEIKSQPTQNYSSLKNTQSNLIPSTDSLPNLPKGLTLVSQASELSVMNVPKGLSIVPVTSTADLIVSKDNKETGNKAVVTPSISLREHVPRIHILPILPDKDAQVESEEQLADANKSEIQHSTVSDYHPIGYLENSPHNKITKTKISSTITDTNDFENSLANFNLQTKMPPSTEVSSVKGTGPGNDVKSVESCHEKDLQENSKTAESNSEVLKVKIKGPTEKDNVDNLSPTVSNPQKPLVGPVTAVKRKARLKISPRLSDTQRNQRMARFAYNVEHQQDQPAETSQIDGADINNPKKTTPVKVIENPKTPETIENNENEAPFNDVSSYCYNMSAFPKCVVQLTRLPFRVEKVFLSKLQRHKEQGIDRFALIKVPKEEEVLSELAALSKTSPKTSEGKNKARSTTRKRKSSIETDSTVPILPQQGGKILRIRNGDEVMCTKVMNRTVEPSEKTRCTFCGKLTQSAHVWRHLLAVYKVKADIDEAIEDEDELEMFQCRHCGANLCSRAALGIHCHHLHGKANQYECKCPCCQEPFLTDVSLACHLETHFQEIFKEGNLSLLPNVKAPKIIYCGLCRKHYNTIERMDKHLCDHNTNLLQNQCKICLKLFTKSYQLKCHMVVHTELRPFKCEQCSKTFRFKSSLRSHNYQHIGVQPYKCKVCDKGFFESGNMLKHMRNIHRENTGLIPEFKKDGSEKKVKRLKLVKIKSPRRINQSDYRPKYKPKYNSVLGTQDSLETNTAQKEQFSEEIDKLQTEQIVNKEGNQSIEKQHIEVPTKLILLNHAVANINAISKLAENTQVIEQSDILPEKNSHLKVLSSVADHILITTSSNSQPKIGATPPISTQTTPVTHMQLQNRPISQNQLQQRLLTHNHPNDIPINYLSQRPQITNERAQNRSIIHDQSQDRLPVIIRKHQLHHRPTILDHSQNIPTINIQHRAVIPHQPAQRQAPYTGSHITHIEQRTKSAVFTDHQANQFQLQAIETAPQELNGPSSLLFHLLTAKGGSADQLPDKGSRAKTTILNGPSSQNQYNYTDNPTAKDHIQNDLNCLLCEAVCVSTHEMADHLLYYHRVSMNKVTYLLQS